MEEKKKTTASKEAFFNDLYNLDEEETTDEEENDVALELKTSKKKPVTAITPEQRATVGARLPTAMGRTMSSPVPLTRASRAHSDDVVDRVKETPIALVPARPQSSKQTTPPPKTARVQTAKQSDPAPKAGKKRKRGKSLEPLPESQQIFKGKAFCEFSIDTSCSLYLYIYIYSFHTRQRHKLCPAIEDPQSAGMGRCVG